MLFNKEFVNNMILGSILGDGSIEKPCGYRKNYLISFTQNSKNEKEKEYIELKYNLIKKYYKVNNIREKHNNTYHFSISTKEKELTENFLKLTRYNDNSRKLPNIEYFNNVVILFWYLDDGSLTIGKQKRNNGFSIYKRIKISLASYKDEDIIKFINNFKLKFNIEFKILKNKNKITDIYIRKNIEIKKFLDFIYPYKDIIPKNQRYKLCLCDKNNNYNICNYKETNICSCRNKNFNLI